MFQLIRTNNNLPRMILLWKCYENIVDITFLFMKSSAITSKNPSFGLYHDK